jgi:hypothetical protein
MLKSLVAHRITCPTTWSKDWGPEKSKTFCPRCAQEALLREMGLDVEGRLMQEAFNPTD